MAVIGLGLSIAGCATVPSTCRKLEGVATEWSREDGRPILQGYRYRDEPSRVRHLHCLADQGAQDAQLQLARRYETGDGVAPDPGRAARLYRRAATTIPPATAVYSPPVRLGGSGQVMLLRNPNARPGLAEAKYRLGRMMLEGRGVERDERRGLSLIDEAARQGHPEAQRWLLERRVREEDSGATAVSGEARSV